MTPAMKFCLFCGQSAGWGKSAEETVICPNCGAFLPQFADEIKQHWPINSLFHEKGYLLRAPLHGGPVYNYYSAIPPKGSDWEKVIVKEFFPINAGYYREPGSDIVKKRDGFAQEEKIYRAALEKELAQLPTDYIPHEIRYPHMENIIDYFDVNMTTYLIINYIEGSPLKSHVISRYYDGKRFVYERYKLPFETLLPMLSPLCRELASYHERGALHNNIKPETLLIVSKDKQTESICLRKEIPGVDDFDPVKKKPSSLLSGKLVKKFNIFRRQPVKSAINGSSLHPTPWRAIETYTAEENGPWTDIYSLCASLYFCITCKEPPLATERLKKDLLCPPGRLGVTLPHHQEQALLKGLAVRPTDRWQSMDEFCDALYG